MIRLFLQDKYKKKREKEIRLERYEGYARLARIILVGTYVLY